MYELASVRFPLNEHVCVCVCACACVSAKFHQDRLKIVPAEYGAYRQEVHVAILC